MPVIHSCGQNSFILASLLEWVWDLGGSKKFDGFSVLEWCLFTTKSFVWKFVKIGGWPLLSLKHCVTTLIFFRSKNFLWAVGDILELWKNPISSEIFRSLYNSRIALPGLWGPNCFYWAKNILGHVFSHAHECFRSKKYFAPLQILSTLSYVCYVYLK